MPHSVLGSLALTYQPLWNRQRDFAGVVLGVHAQPGAQAVDAAHLLHTLADFWDHAAPPVLLSVSSPSLFLDVLRQLQADSPWLLVPSDRAALSSLSGPLGEARRRGARLVWQGPLAEQPARGPHSPWDRSLIQLTASDTLHLVQHQRATPTSDAPSAESARLRTAFRSQLIEGVANAQLVGHLLDDLGVWALAGWPVDELMHHHRFKGHTPSCGVLQRLLRALDRDEATDRIEALLLEEPLLAYRYLQHVNSAGIGLRSGVESVRHGLMMLGTVALRRWVAEHGPFASDEVNLLPVHHATRLRAQLMVQLLNPGADDELRAEVYLCGLFSGLDLWLGESLGHALKRLPLSERLYQAHITQEGPYVGPLQLAAALELGDTATLRRLCHQHDTAPEDINRALLRMLSQQRVHTLPD